MTSLGPESSAGTLGPFRIPPLAPFWFLNAIVRPGRSHGGRRQSEVTDATPGLLCREESRGGQS
ncbi:MAG: hypothetical protein E6J41_06945 [Chloroflexi bacterium]|nr:MAG: hypothetical protein E6J41_06945 [Chloroflexota bacterium]